MPIRYKEYTIFHDESGGVTVHRDVSRGYGPVVKQRNSFSSVGDALVYIADRETVTNNTTLEQVIESTKHLRRDLMSIGQRLLKNCLKNLKNK